MRQALAPCLLAAPLLALEIHNHLAAIEVQDGNPNGWIKDYGGFVGEDGQRWGDPVARGSFANDAARKSVSFPRPTTGRFLRFVARSGHAKGPWASLAELEVQEAR